MKVNSFKHDKLYTGRELRMTAPEGIYSQRRSTNAQRYFVVLLKEGDARLPRTIFTIYNDQVEALAKEGLNEYTEFVKLPGAYLRIAVAQDGR